MAKADAAVEPKSGGGLSVLGLLIISVIAVGSGAFFGTLVPGLVEQKATKQNPEMPHGAVDIPAGASLEPLGPITTNLANPSTTWIRLETMLVVEKGLGQNAEIIKKAIAEDILGYLRSVRLDQLAGASGFQHLKEDISDRVRIRSEGKASGIIVTTMILE